MLSELGAKLAPGCMVIGTNCICAKHQEHLHSHLHFHMQKQVAAQVQVQLQSLVSICSTIYHCVVVVQLLVTCSIDCIPMCSLYPKYQITVATVIL